MIKLPEAILVANIIVHDLELLTGNVNDFKPIPGLRIVEPWLLKLSGDL
jgi:predicted nucleic acid-binding protein